MNKLTISDKDEINADITLSNLTNSNFNAFGCRNLKSLDISSFDFSDKYAFNFQEFNSCIDSLNNMFKYCVNLTNLKLGKKLKDSLDLGNCPLTHESVISVLNGLAEVEEEQTLWLSKKSFSTLMIKNFRKTKKKNWKIISYNPNNEESKYNN